MTHRAPTSLAGTLAAYEARKRSISSIQTSEDTEMDHQEAVHSHTAEAIYKRSLPSLHFLRWRPLYHLQAPSGWMNDPCAPGFDPSTGLYHLFFQWNPRRNIYGAIAWGAICWGHAISKDMIHWTVSPSTALKPGAWYDREGCFTGCMVPTTLQGQPGGITLLYTGVSRLPLHYTLPYTQKTETLNIATSANNGQTWDKMKGNPIHPEPPVNVSVTGWRDPFVAPWPSMDKLLGVTGHEKTLYGMISGGIRDETPTAFLYTVNPNDLREWVFINSIINLEVNHNISRWSGDMGINWECANFMTLTCEDDGFSREFIIVGAEGANGSHPNSTFAEYPQQSTKFPRYERSLQWMSGTLETTEVNGKSVPTMKYAFGGRFDHGCLYGVNSFLDPSTSKHTAWGWITEEDLPQKLVDRQSWSGMMSLPREVKLIKKTNVVGALRSKLKEVTSFEVEAQHNNTFVVRTLGIMPAVAVEALREGTRRLQITNPTLLTPQSKAMLDIQTCRFEVDASFAVSDACSRIGLSIFHSQGHEANTATTIYLETATETVTVERPDSSDIDSKILTMAENAPFTLLSFKEGDKTVREPLEIRAFFDESVLEVFINQRCTFATRVYPHTKRCWGLHFWADDTSRQSSLIHASAWDGLRADIKVN